VQPATSLDYRATADGDRGSRHREVSVPQINRIIDERIKPDDLWSSSSIGQPVSVHA
jgi:hypothetical protein